MPKKENLNDFYIKTLLFSQRIRKKTPEKRNLYLDAFFGLIRNGYPYEIEEVFPKEKSAEEEDDAKGKKGKHKTLLHHDPAFGKEPVKTLVIKIDDSFYKCTEVDLQYAFGTLYEKVTASRKSKKDKNANDSFFLPDVFSENYLKTAQSNLPAKQETGPVAQNEEKATIPYVAFDTNYLSDDEDSKEYDSFLFNHHETHVRYVDGTERTYLTYVFPLNPDTSDCLATDIVSIMVDHEGNIRPETSSPEATGQKSVNEVFKDISFVVRGHWEDGRFISSVALLNTKDGAQPLVTDSYRTIAPTRRTSSFYLRHIEENGNVLNVFPLGLLHNDQRTGLAPCVMMLETGHSREMFLSGDNSPIAMSLNKKNYLASAYWAVNSLNLSLEVDRK